MVCGPRRSATCNGSRSNCPRAASTFTGSRTGFPACTQSGVTRCERCASYGAITRETPTYSFPSAAGQSVPSVSIDSSSASGRPPRCHSRSTRTCFAMHAGSSWQTMATIRGPCSTTSGTRTSSTPSGTPTWRQTGSRTFGGIDDGGAGSIAPHGRSSRSKRTTRHIVEITRPAAMAPCAPSAPASRCPQTAILSRPDIVRSGASRRRHALPRLALLRSDRSVDLHHQPVRLALGRFEHRESGSRYPLDHFDRTAWLRFKRGLDVLDHGLKLLVRQLLDQIAVLNLVLARDQQCQDLEVGGRLRLAHPRDSLLPV